MRVIRRQGLRNSNLATMFDESGARETCFNCDLHFCLCHGDIASTFGLSIAWATCLGVLNDDGIAMNFCALLWLYLTHAFTMIGYFYINGFNTTIWGSKQVSSNLCDFIEFYGVLEQQ